MLTGYCDGPSVFVSLRTDDFFSLCTVFRCRFSQISYEGVNGERWRILRGLDRRKHAVSGRSRVRRSRRKLSSPGGHRDRDGRRTDVLTHGEDLSSFGGVNVHSDFRFLCFSGRYSRGVRGNTEIVYKFTRCMGAQIRRTYLVPAHCEDARHWFSGRAWTRWPRFDVGLVRLGVGCLLIFMARTRFLHPAPGFTAHFLAVFCFDPWSVQWAPRYRKRPSVSRSPSPLGVNCVFSSA